MLNDRVELGAAFQASDFNRNLDIDTLMVHAEYFISDVFSINLSGKTLCQDSDTRTFGMALQYYWDR